MTVSWPINNFHMGKIQLLLEKSEASGFFDSWWFSSVQAFPWCLILVLCCEDALSPCCHKAPKHSWITALLYLCFLEDSLEPVAASAPTVFRTLKSEVLSVLYDVWRVLLILCILISSSHPCCWGWVFSAPWHWQIEALISCVHKFMRKLVYSCEIAPCVFHSQVHFSHKGKMDRFS